MPDKSYKTLIQLLPDIVYKIDPEGYFTYLNNSVKNLGYDPDELIRKHFSTIIHPDDTDISQHSIVLKKFKGKVTPKRKSPKLFDERRTGKRITKNLNIRLISKNFKEIKNDKGEGITYAEIVSVGLYDETFNEGANKFIGTIGIIKDISNIIKSDEVLLSIDRHYRTLIENSTDIITIISTDGTILFESPSIKRILGYEPFDLIGNNIFEYIHQIDTQDIANSLDNEIDNTDLTFNAECKFRHNNGLWRTLEIKGKRVQDENEELMCFILNSRDISQRKEAEEKLQKSEKTIKQSFEQLQKTLRGIVQAMAKTIELKDPYTAGHQKRVAELACAIAAELGLSEKMIEGIYIAGSIHDIGKLAVPAEILNKPSKLSDSEFSLISTHPQIGFDILKEINFPWPIDTIIYQHHEKIDGSGYPLGLSGENILFQAKIISVANVIEAMSSHRPYRASLGIESALDEIIKFKGKHYDPEVVDACVAVFKKKKFKFSTE